MNDDELAKALLSDRCCQNCISCFDMRDENDNNIYFCGNEDPLLDGCLLSINGLRNRTLLTNTCKHFKYISDCAAPMPYIFPVFEEEDNEK